MRGDRIEELKEEEILTAASSALTHAKLQVRELEVEIARISGLAAYVETARTSIESIRLAACAAERQQQLKQTWAALGGLLGELQDRAGQSVQASRAIRALARALSLVYQLVAASEALEKPAPRTASDRKSTRRQEAVRWPRAECERRRFDVSLGTDSETNFYTGLERDVTSCGLFIATFEAVAPGTKVSVDIRLPGGHSLAVQGEVGWVRELSESNPDLLPGLGIVFEELSDLDRQEIESYLAQRDALLYETG